MKSLKELEEESQKEFEEYCQKTKTPALFWLVIAMFIIGGIVYIKGYLDAGIQ